MTTDPDWWHHDDRARVLAAPPSPKRLVSLPQIILAVEVTSRGQRRAAPGADAPTPWRHTLDAAGMVASALSRLGRLPGTGVTPMSGLARLARDRPRCSVATAKAWKQRKILPWSTGVLRRAYTKRTEPEGHDGAQAADRVSRELCTRSPVYWKSRCSDPVDAGQGFRRFMRP